MIVDDIPETFKYNYGNAILVKQYQGEKNDIELFLLLNYLEMISREENFIIIDKRYWQSKIDFL